jgi:hypothetical protein
MKLHFSTSMLALAVVLGDLGFEAWQLWGSFQSKLLRTVPVGLTFHGNVTHLLLGAIALILCITVLSLYLQERR